MIIPATKLRTLTDSELLARIHTVGFADWPPAAVEVLSRFQDLMQEPKAEPLPHHAED